MAKQGTWQHLRGKFPLWEEEPSSQKRVDQAKEKYRALDQCEMARALTVALGAKDKLERELSEANTEAKALSQLLVAIFEATGVSSFKMTSGETCFQRMEPYSAFEDRKKLFAWIKKEKMQKLLTVQWQMMNSLTKERLKAGQPPPPGVKVFFKIDARMTGRKKGKEVDTSK